MISKTLALSSGLQAYRESGGGPAVVLLHGISSGAASWEPLSPLLPDYRLLAWDAPGYGESQPLTESEPTAADYAARLDAWLDALEVERCVLVGHSLGAMMACAYMALRPERLAGVILADPAQGYRDADDAKRDAVYRSRWPMLVEQGPEVYAEERAPRLLRDSAREADLTRVRKGIKRLHVSGFAQANWMLANDAMEGYVDGIMPVPALVLCGDEDRITPPEDAQSLATRLRLAYHSIPCAGHASYIDAPAAFAAAIDDFAGRLLTKKEEQ